LTVLSDFDAATFVTMLFTLFAELMPAVSLLTPSLSTACRDAFAFHSRPPDASIY